MRNSGLFSLAAGFFSPARSGSAGWKIMNNPMKLASVLANFGSAVTVHGVSTVNALMANN
ncbi:hypothetical protein SLEP1_g42440 [Rubroshorea leprosula]|uniref:Uncharacterized protein n=1 Tax=Rubroshorea leprosula TaxID=152421 RepID=A0AAV5LAG6_9ROSI|nr:hypothetical protein SLEP1_g42440 [Rubroshorea leprosula]